MKVRNKYISLFLFIHIPSPTLLKHLSFGSLVKRQILPAPKFAFSLALNRCSGEAQYAALWGF